MRSSPEAYDLLHKGAICLAQISAQGIRVDVSYLDRMIHKCEHKIGELTDKIRSTDVFDMWRRRFGERTKLGSGQQLASILFDELKLPYKGEFTNIGRYKTDSNTLATVKHPFVRDWLKLEKLKDMKGTNLEAIRRETINGYLHPNFGLNKAKTYRSTSSDPNFQNIPVRDPIKGKAIRRCFIPRQGNRLAKLDYSGIEVKIAACYNKDPRLLEYIKDPTKDMHRDMAGEIFILEKENIDKKTRYYAKNQFVFPEFYGSVYFQCAKPLWDSAIKQGLRDHLKSKGITKLGSCDPQQEPKKGTFEHHLKEVERRFWQERFKVYHQWKWDWYKAYREKGGFLTLTGFWIEGLMKRNEVINYPVQGSAFHCLLLSVILLHRWLGKHKFQTKIVGQIHDEMDLDGPDNEMNDVLSKAKQIMIEEVPRRWPWIIVPLDVEVEVSDVDGTWYDAVPWLQKEDKTWYAKDLH